MNLKAQENTNDSTKLKFPVPVSKPYEKPSIVKSSGLFLNSPENVKTYIEYDPIRGEYVIKQKIGNLELIPPVYLNQEDFKAYQFEKTIRDYWREKRRSESFGKTTGLLPKMQIGGEAFDRVFGGNTIDIIPQGQANLTFGFNSQKINNPSIDEKDRNSFNLDYQSDIQLNVTGKIGEKLKLNVQYNTEASFNFENNVKIEYTGDEDEIIQKLEVGNVSLPLEGSLITGSQGLFGFKTALKFGKLTVTSIFTQQQSETSTIEISGGAQTRDFEIKIDNYDENKHFFLSHYFRDRYNKSLANLPIINSGVQITKIEIWVTNKNDNFENSRNLVAFLDLGEGTDPNNPSETNLHNNSGFITINSGSYPDNNLNDLYNNLTTNYSGIREINAVTNTLSNISGFNIGTDYEKLQNARLLNANEYTVNYDLGYVSLNSGLNNDEVLAVAYEYTLGGKTYKVGELSTGGIDASQTLIVKLLKGTNFNPRIKSWELMMKNIYDIGAYQIKANNFKLDVLYNDDQSGNKIPYLPEGSLNKQLLLSLLNLDNVNSSMDQYPDGIFDFIDGATVIAQKGKIVFPLLEPFGNDLAALFAQNEGDLIRKYVFQELYDSTLTKARQLTSKNKFLLAGEYESSSSSEIMLNALNVPQGSVVVTSGGVKLIENQDYTVDYTLGRVKILRDDLLASGAPIKITLESNSFFNMRDKSLLGSHFNYEFSKNFHVGATILNLSEKPITGGKVNIGDEPISNTIWGLNASYTTESQTLTTLIDKLPFVETKTPSRIMFTGEFAHLIPGHSRHIDKDGTAYIDDFESSETSYEIKSWNGWKLSSTPSSFKESMLSNDLEYNFNRAKIAWYWIDRIFYESRSETPTHIKQDPEALSNHFVRQVFEKELFPNKDLQPGLPSYIPVLNVAYYPKERGPYNYNTIGTANASGLNSDGTLNNPESRWGGMMRYLRNSNFEASNYEYIEFWLMDPYVENKTHDGGKLLFNLGNISEDILKDSRKAFEAGLPPTNLIENVDTTVWGRIPSGIDIQKSFLNEDSRQYQDIGFDGLGSLLIDNPETSPEYTFYEDYVNQVLSIANDASQSFIDSLKKDPSADDYHYFRGTDYDDLKLGILERYKHFNSLEGNSLPTGTIETYSTMSNTEPDTEDINDDNTLNETNSYYEYEVDLRPENMDIGLNPYITDKIIAPVTFANKEESEVTWYQFKIPIKEYTRKFGPIDDFSSIRFMRMFLTDFKEEVILRFAKMDLVRGEWRRFDLSFAEGAEGTTSPQAEQGSFEISAVNFEENANRFPVNYILPPNITRNYDPFQPQLVMENEQAMVLKVRDLADGNAKAAYKNINMDMRKYKHIKMDVHAEKLINEELKDNDLSLFFRMGSDYKDNFYEYEVPLKLTPHLPDETTKYDKDNDRRIVWPDENRIDFDLILLSQAKQARNDEMNKLNSDINLNTIYSILHGKNKIKIKGNPSLSNVKVLIIGIRNPNAQNDYTYTDDGLPKSAEIWVNELRLTDFDEKGGWAANARMTANLADLGTVTVAGGTATAGFGSIEKKVSERNLEDTYQYDISTNIELGKFFPEKFGVKLPLYMGFSRTYINPQYNPMDPDIPLEAALNNAETKEERDSIKFYAQDFTERKSINFTNIQIAPKTDKKDKKKHFYDISNFSTSYAYNETFFRNVNTEYNLLKNYNAAFSYNYMHKPNNFMPFKKTKAFKGNSFKLLKDFNFYLAPSQINFRTDVNRKYNEVKRRNISNSMVQIPETYEQDFLWNRNYTVKYDLTKQLKLIFNATNTARIDEPLGMVNKERDPSTYEHWKDSVVNNFLNGGRNINYKHAFDLTYSVPINKIAFFNWVNTTLKYTSTYNWQSAPILNSSTDFNPGNTISNSNSIQINANANLLNFYNKVPYFKKINQEYRSSSKRKKTEKYKTVSYEEKNLKLFEKRNKTITHNLKTKDVVVKAFEKSGKLIQGSTKIVDDKKIRFRTSKEYSDVKIVVTGKVLDKENPLKKIIAYTFRTLMSVENISASYSIKQNSVLPGYLPDTRFMGLNKLNGMMMPGIPFVLGWQDENFANYAARNNMLSTDTSLTAPFSMQANHNFSIRSSVKPLNDFKIDLSATKAWLENNNRYYVADAYGNFNTSNPNSLINGNYSISTLTLGSAFEKSSKTFKSATFQNFIEYRSIIAERIAQERSSSDPNYNRGNETTPDGYSLTSQNVLIPAFIAAYTAADPYNVKTDKKPQLPLPNWSVNYNGLTKISFFKKHFKTFNLKHQYRSTFTIGSYISNEAFGSFDEEFGFSDLRNSNFDFIDQYDYNNISIDEKFAPLISLDFTLNNSLNVRLENKKSRRIELSMANNQITETKNDEYIVGIGFRFEKVPFMANNKKVTGQLDIRTDFSYRSNKTILRTLEDANNTLNAGQGVVSFKFNTDYIASQRLNIRFFVNYDFTNPYINNIYSKKTYVGVSVRFNLSE